MSFNTSWLSRLGLFVGVCLLASGLYLIDYTPTVMSQETTNEDAETRAETAQTEPESNSPGYCLICHENSSQTFSLADGSVHPVGVDLDALAGSVHGVGNEEGALACADCHEGVAFPHNDPLPETDRAYTVSRSINCTSCHEEQTENLADGVHYSALIDGNLRAASCVDCHGGHDVQPVDEPVWASSQACGDCHTTTFTEFRDSVHGEALFDGDANAPVCTECHGVHGIQHPTTALFRNRSPELCATCHADEDLMAEYDISTNVFDSYLSDFHGSTVAIFNQTAPNVPTNKAVCYDCHGVHNITPADDDKSQVVRENLLITCQQCHPGATTDFPESWVGHFEPTVESHPFLFLVDLFYDVLIPITLGGFAILISTDIFRRLRKRLSGKGD